MRGNRSRVRAEEPAEARTSAPDSVCQSNEKFRQRIGVFCEPLVHRAEHLLGRDFALNAAHGAQGRIIAQLPDQRRHAGHGRVRMSHQQQSARNSLAAVSRPAHNLALWRPGPARKETRHQPGDVNQCQSRAGSGQIATAGGLRIFCRAILSQMPILDLPVRERQPRPSEVATPAVSPQFQCVRRGSQNAWTIILYQCIYSKGFETIHLSSTGQICSISPSGTGAANLVSKAIIVVW